LEPIPPLKCKWIAHEARVALFAATKAVELGYKFVICEGDTMNVIFPLQSSSTALHWTPLRISLLELYLS